MSEPSSQKCLGLVIRSGPWRGRSNRDQLDVALMAAAMEWDLVIYFQPQGLLHLLREQNGKVADLPPGNKAWASINEMTSARFLADEEVLKHFSDLGARWHCDVESLSSADRLKLDDDIAHWWVL